MVSAIDTLVDAAPDAIQLTIGQARLLQSRPGRFKPSLVLRSDVANVYGTQLPDRLSSLPIEQAALTAAQLDATCLVVNIFDMPGTAGAQGTVHSQRPAVACGMHRAGDSADGRTARHAGG